MNRAQKTIENEVVSEVSSLLIPLAHRQLLVPTATVAEIVPYRAPQHHPESPDWYLGDIVWREQRIPLISYEVLCGDAMPPYAMSCRIAVLNNTGVDESLPFLGLAAQGIPRLSRVKPDEVHEREDAQPERFDLMHVSHAGESVVIPDVTALQQAFLDYRASVGD
jgi:chemosensory pili system protein ChpC